MQIVDIIKQVINGNAHYNIEPLLI